MLVLRGRSRLELYLLCRTFGQHMLTGYCRHADMMADVSDDCDCDRCIAEREDEDFSDSDDSMPDLDEPEDSESEVHSVD
jgi:hypothetical protein